MARVVIDGKDWTAWPLEGPLSRPTGDAGITAEPVLCDNESQTDEESGRTQLRLVPIEGIPSNQALYDPGDESQVYVNVGPEIQDVDRLPPLVQELLSEG